MVELLALLAAGAGAVAVGASLWRDLAEKEGEAVTAAWRRADFELGPSGWTRGGLWGAHDGSAFHLKIAVPTDVSMGASGPVPVDAELQLNVASPLQLAWWNLESLAHAVVLQGRGAHIAEGWLLASVSSEDLKESAYSMERLAGRLADPPTLDDLVQLARGDGPLRVAAAEALATLAPDRLIVVAKRGEPVPRFIAALALQNWEALGPMLEDSTIPEERRDEATQCFVDALNHLGEEEALRIAVPFPRLLGEAALAFHRWDRLPDRTWLATNGTMCRRVLDALHEDGHTNRALREALELHPWWALSLLETPPSGEALAILRAVVEDPHGDRKAQSIGAQFLERWGTQEDIPRLRRLTFRGIDERVATLQRRLGLEGGALSMADLTGGSLSMVDPPLSEPEPDR